MDLALNMSHAISLPDDAIRDITAEEIAAFDRDGWVKLPGLIKTDVVAEMLRRIHRILGQDTENYSGVRKLTKEHNILRNHVGAWRTDPYLRAVVHSRQMGRVAARFLQKNRVRFFHDEILAKRPASEGFKPTAYHQDFPYHAFDRPGRMLAVWIAVDDVPADRGSMRFLEGSQHSESLGRLAEVQDVIAENPWLTDRYPISDPIDLKQGDATVHGDLTIHGAPANHTTSIRWAYLVKLFDAQARYSGVSTFDDGVEGIEVNQPFDTDRYPIVYDEDRD